MIRIFGPGLVGLLVLGLWIYCLFDVISTDESLARNLPKGLWLLLVIFLGPVGCMAWLIMGRPLYAGWRPGDTNTRPARPVVGPEDAPGWGGSRAEPAAGASAADRRHLEEWEAELHRREDELRRREEGDPPADGPGFPHTW